MPDSSNGMPGSPIENLTIKHPQSHKPEGSNLSRWVSANYQNDGALTGNATTFSYSDVTATILLPFSVGSESPECRLPGLTLISLSEHRDVYPVVGLGRRGIKGFTTGHRTTAGTLGFTLFGENPFAEACKKYNFWRGLSSQNRFTSPDELPPFNLVLLFANSNGETSSVIIRSLKLLDRSQTVSVRDIQLTEVYSFMAANCTYFIEDLSYDKPGYEPGDRLIAVPNRRPDSSDSDFVETKPVTTITTTDTTTTTTTTTTTFTITNTTTTTPPTTPDHISEITRSPHEY